MNKRQAIAEFAVSVAPSVLAAYGPRDGPAWREAWNDWTDALCKEGRISLEQYETWGHPDYRRMVGPLLRHCHENHN